MNDMSGPFSKARSLNEAKEYSWPVLEVVFDRDRKIVKIDYETDNDEFYYDSQGNPIKIISESWGYRGSPSYKFQYEIRWDNETPTSITRKTLEFEDDFGESNPSDIKYETDFREYEQEYVNSLIKETGSKIKIYGDVCKLTNGRIPVWCEITYYRDG